MTSLSPIIASSLKGGWLSSTPSRLVPRQERGAECGDLLVAGRLRARVGPARCLGEVLAHRPRRVVQREEGVRFPQIIMSTHSPYILDSFEPEEVTFLSRPPDDPNGPVRARPLRDAPNIRERMGGEFYLGELWYNLSEEELFGEP